MKDLPVPSDMLLTAQRNIGFFLRTLYSLFESDWETLQNPPTNETEAQRINRIISKKEGFIQSSLVILFNSAEIYLKAKIAESSVFLLLKNINDAGSQNSFFDCQTIDAQYLPKIYEGITRNQLTNVFKNSYESLRKERNKVIHLGKSNNISIRKDLIVSFLSLSMEIAKAPIVEISSILLHEEQNMTPQQKKDAQESYSEIIISILKSFFPLDDIIKDAYELDNPPRSWILCNSCHNPSHSLAVISNKKSLCLSCGFKNGV
ncbi:hypothetical protein NE897_07465 [Yersinia ruckeri]|uniref:hypothetical protein n=1 Tax=Yersinia ruckeri TaxID=29486 RepID=UPI0020BF335E|nr:hypothetical protein [Yersinia ruckeri]EKN4181808.1 hypothetical protein [Yersinia ruckeri]MCK8554497.1 hypothetical protein [Yersinia ruckeri]MCW6545542.1 hypothetical protein [Yersinia ruckeri]MCW6571152.1 hypothetical protein [Yersinia ruckeri]